MLFNKRRTMLIRKIIQKNCDGLLHSNLLETTSSQWKSQRKWPLNYIPTAIGRNANNVDQCRKISLALVFLFRQSQLSTSAVFAAEVNLSSTPLGLTSVAKMADIECCDCDKYILIIKTIVQNMRTIMTHYDTFLDPLHYPVRESLGPQTTKLTCHIVVRSSKHDPAYVLITVVV